MTTITLLGGQHPVAMPSIGIAEALLIAAGAGYSDARGIWALAACVGCCSTAANGMRGVSLATCRMDVLVYGEAVYSHLRERGATATGIIEAARSLVPMLSARVAPATEEEVAAHAGFSGAGPGGST